MQNVNLNIVVAEDNPISSKLLESLILKITVTPPALASDGNQAIEQVSKAKIDLLLIDNQMPNRTGKEAVEIIRRDPSIHQPYIVGLSASASGEEEEFEKCGLDEFVSKPILPDKLERVIMKLSAGPKS